MTVRIHHGSESRPNLVISNLAGQYKAYCQSCKDGDVVTKEHVLLSERVPVVPRVLELPHDMERSEVSEFVDVVGAFLASKGMMFPYLPQTYFSRTQKRMLVQDDAGLWHGRDITGRSARKWLNYGEAKFVGTTQATTVLTEDLFSMYKVRFAMRDRPDVAVCCTLGAECTAAAALALSKCKNLVWAYDADKAGDKGYTRAIQRMRPWGATQHRARPPFEGTDPKDMDCANIRLMLENLV